MDLENHFPVIQIEVGRGIIEHGRLVDVEVEPLRRLQLESGLDAGGRESLLRSTAAAPGSFRSATDLTKTTLGRAEFLGIVVTRYPPGGVIAGHRKFGQLFFDVEIRQGVFHREFIAESETVVIQAETDLHHPVALVLERHERFVVMVPDAVLLSPDRMPDLIKGALFDPLDDESILE